MTMRIPVSSGQLNYVTENGILLSLAVPTDHIATGTGAMDQVHAAVLTLA